MHTLYHNVTTQKRSAWRSAYEVKVAALEHEKRRFLMMQDNVGLEKPQATHIQANQKPGWASLVKLPLRLLANLMG